MHYNDSITDILNRNFIKFKYYNIGELPLQSDGSEESEKNKTIFNKNNDSEESIIGEYSTNYITHNKQDKKANLYIQKFLYFNYIIIIIF